MKKLLTFALAAVCLPVDPHLSGASPDPAALDDVLEPIRSRHELPALAGAVALGDKLAAIGAVGVRKHGAPARVTAGDRFHLGSLTKSMTATLVGVLVEEGKLSWDTTIGAVFPELKEKIRPEYLPVTIAQLLTHRGGLPEDQTPDALFFKLRFIRGPIREQRRRVVEAVLAVPPAATPGAKMLYSNHGYVVAGAMVEAVAGEPRTVSCSARSTFSCGRTSSEVPWVNWMKPPVSGFR